MNTYSLIVALTTGLITSTGAQVTDYTAPLRQFATNRWESVEVLHIPCEIETFHPVKPEGLTNNPAIHLKINVVTPGFNRSMTDALKTVTAQPAHQEPVDVRWALIIVSTDGARLTMFAECESKNTVLCYIQGKRVAMSSGLIEYLNQLLAPFR